MNRAEMNRRIQTMSPELAEQVHQLVLGGNGASTIKFETDATLKQINAVFEWTRRYGRIIPQPEEATVPGLRALFNF